LTSSSSSSSLHHHLLKPTEVKPCNTIDCNSNRMKNINVNLEKDNNSNRMNGINVEKDNNSNGHDNNLSNELNNMNIGSRRGSGKNCLCCLKIVEGSSRCSKCRTALYCSTACQIKHWPVHKNSCIDSNDSENSDVKLFMKAENHFNQGNQTY